MAIDLSSFEKALNTLDRAILRARESPGDEELRDAVIQRFEYTYELAWKSLKRVLEEAAASSDEIDYLSFKDLIRRGAESGMIQDPQEWFAFRKSRNITSHVYNEKKALSVYDSALRFAKAARILLSRLRDWQRDRADT